MLSSRLDLFDEKQVNSFTVLVRCHNQKGTWLKVVRHYYMSFIAHENNGGVAQLVRAAES